MPALNRPLLVAELCQNHLGDPALLEDMVHAAAQAGADLVKIQALYSADLTRRDRFEDGATDEVGAVRVIKRPFAPEYERLRGLDLDPEAEQRFVEICHEAGVEAMITLFTRAAADRLAGYGFDAVKIASYDCSSYPLLRDAAARWSRMFVSTGSMFAAEIERAVALLDRPGLDVTFLHCVSVYPTPLELLALGRIRTLAGLAGRAGFSDHTHYQRDGLWAAKAALAGGAAAIERHFTILDADRTKDGPVSIPPKGLAELRRFADLASEDRVAELDDARPDWRAWSGREPFEPSAEELRNRDYYRGRVASHVNGRSVYNWEDVDLDVVGRLPAVPLTAGVDR